MTRQKGKIDLSPNYLPEAMQNRITELNSTISFLERRIARLEQGVIHVTKSNGSYQYRLYEPGTQNRTYFPKSQINRASQMVQREYDENALETIKREKRALQLCLDNYQNEAVELCYEQLPKGKQTLVNPIFLPDDMFIENWLSQEYDHMGFDDDAPEYYAEHGERVRSKSEVIIADKLYHMGIPYLYEFPIVLNNGVLVHPDFACLFIKERRVIFFEHFGLMDSPEYMEKALKKISDYQATGYRLGKDFIFTTETASMPLNMKALEKMLKEVFFTD